MDLNSRLFDSIRISPTCEDAKSGKTQSGRARQGDAREAQQAGGPACEAPGCTHPGLYRAPKGRKQEGQYWQFCIDHVRAYNASYNYFDGMNDAAVQAYQKDAIIGHRPTWAMGTAGAGKADPRKSDAGRSDAGGSGAGASGAERHGTAQAERDWAYADPLGILRAAGIGPQKRTPEPEPRRPRYSAAVRKALDVLGLDESADRAAIKAQYKTLVKRFHPDANGGDRSFEDRLRDIIRAHDVLRVAGLY